MIKPGMIPNALIAPRPFSAIEARRGRSSQLDRVPRLLLVLKDSCGLAETELSRLCRNAKVSFAGCAEGRAGDAVGTGWSDAVLIELSTEQSGSAGAMLVGRGVVYAICERALGSSTATRQPDVMSPPSGVELRFAGLIGAIMCNALTRAFADVAPDVVIHAAESKPGTTLEAIGLQQVAVFAAGLDVDLGGDPQKVIVILKHSFIAPMRDLLSVSDTPSTSQQVVKTDAKWTRRLTRGVSQTHVDMKAVLEEREMSLGDIMRMRVGDVVQLDATTSSLAVIESAGVPLFRCELGRQSDQIVLSLHSTIASGEIDHAPSAGR